MKQNNILWKVSTWSGGKCQAQTGKTKWNNGSPHNMDPVAWKVLTDRSQLQ